MKRDTVINFVKAPIPQRKVIFMLGTVIFVILGAVWAHSNGTFATKDTTRGIKELVIMNKQEIKEVRYECNNKFEKIRVEQKADLQLFRAEQRTDLNEIKRLIREGNSR